MTSLKERDLAGPGIGDYDELAHVLPADYVALLSPRETHAGALRCEAADRGPALRRSSA